MQYYIVSLLLLLFLVFVAGLESAFIVNTLKADSGTRSGSFSVRVFIIHLRVICPRRCVGNILAKGNDLSLVDDVGRGGKI